MLKTIKRYKRINKKEQFLRHLVSAYASPWAKRRGTFRDLEEKQSQRNTRLTNLRFSEDLQAVIAHWLTGFQGESMDTLTRQAMGLMLFNNPEKDLLDIEKSLSLLLGKKTDKLTGCLDAKTAATGLLDQIIEPENNIFFRE